MARNPLTACARLSGDITSDRTPTEVGGSMPAASPVSTRSARKTSMFGAKADAITDTTSSNRPTSITGRRPNESDSGPAVTKETAHAANVAVAN